MGEIGAVAWRAAGSPLPDHPDLGTGCCSCCAATATIWPATVAISRNFTGYDQWIHPAGTTLCAPCTWTYRCPALRSQAHQVDHHPEACNPLDLPSVLHQLAAGPMPSHRALVVPLHPGRRHLVPIATWGHVTTESGPLPWRCDDVEILSHYVWLRSQGFPAAALQQRAPTYQHLRRLAPPHQAQTLTLWRRLDPWRIPDSPWLALASRITKEVR